MPNRLLEQIFSKSPLDPLCRYQIDHKSNLCQISVPIFSGTCEFIVTFTCGSNPSKQPESDGHRVNTAFQFKIEFDTSLVEKVGSGGSGSLRLYRIEQPNYIFIV